MRSWSALAAVTAAVLAVPGSAVGASVSPTTKKVVGATASVSSCGSLSGIGISWTVTANVVTAVSLTSIPAACNGGTLSITFVGTGNASLGSAGPVTVSGTSQTFSSITGSPTATSVTDSYVSVVGP